MSILYVKGTVTDITSDENYQTITVAFSDDQDNPMLNAKYTIPTSSDSYVIMQLLGNIRAACMTLYRGSIIGDTINIGDIITSQ